MIAFTDDEYTVRFPEFPRLKQRGEVRDADGNPVLRITREGFRGPVWYTFRDPDGTPVFHVETTTRSVGGVKYTTRRYPVVEADADEPLAVLVKRWVGPFKRRFDVESAEGSRLATIASRSRLRGFLRAIPLLWVLVTPLTYEVTTPDGRTVAAILDRPKVMGREYAVLVPHAGDFPWAAVFAAVALHGRAGIGRPLRLP